MALINKNEPKPFIELTEAAIKELENIGEVFKRSRGDAEAIKAAGFNVDKLESILEQGEKMREIILKRFT